MLGDLYDILSDIDLEQYTETFKNAGFDDWDSLSMITEPELAALDIPLGHRRRLQREIARRSGWADNEPLPSTN